MLGDGVSGDVDLAQKRLNQGCLKQGRLKKRVPAGFALALLGVAAVTLAACGRAGQLEPPPGPAVGVSPTASAGRRRRPRSSARRSPGDAQAAQKNGFDAYGNPVAPPGEKRSFFLDFLLR